MILKNPFSLSRDVLLILTIEIILGVGFHMGLFHVQTV